jgi:acyl-CoA thioesterase I
MDSKRRMILRYAAMSLFVASLAGCDGARRTGAADRAVERDHEDAAPRHNARPTIVFLGTSLTAGLGLDPDQAYPALIQKKLDSAGLDYQVANAGVSGETSAGARGRIDWLLQQPATVLVVETGANDGLRGLNVDSLRGNIQAIFDRARQQRPPPRLVLVGMAALPNFGADYGDRFRRIYPELARANGAALVPFLLEGVAGEDRLNQADGMHPTAEGQQRLAENVWRVLEPVLRAPTS